MTTRHVVAVEIPATPDAVLESFRDPQLHEAATQAADGVRVTHATAIETDDGQLTVAVRRAIPAASLPSQARAWIGQDLELRQVEVWAPADAQSVARHATVDADITGAPVRAVGSALLEPVPGGTRLTYDLAVTCAIPLVGKQIEMAAREPLQQAADALADAVRWWVTNH